MQDKRIEALLQMLAAGRNEKGEMVRADVESTLSPEQKALFQKAMSDSNVAQQLLKTPQATQLLKKLQNGGGKNGSE